MAVDLFDKSQVSQIITEIEGSENRDRKIYEFEAYEIYSGNQRKHVKKELQRLFPETHESMRVSNINILKKVVDKISRVYKTPPLRTLGGDNPNNETLAEVYEKFDKQYAQMDKSFNRHKNTLVWVQNDLIEKTKFRLLILNPYSFDLVINPDNFMVEAVILSYPDDTVTSMNGNLDKSKVRISDGINQFIAEGQEDSAPRFKTYSMWTPTQHVKIRQKKEIDNKVLTTEITYIEDPLNPNGDNPLGMLPFRWLTTDPDVPEFPIASPLPFESVNINILESDIITASALQGFGILLTTAEQGSKTNVIHQGFNIAMHLDQPSDPDAPRTTAEYLNPSPDLGGMRDVVNTYAEAVISDHGLMNFSLAGSGDKFASGLDRALSMADVTEVREMNQADYMEVETDVFEIIKKYDEINATKLFDKDDKLQVLYSKPKILTSEKETLELIEKKLDRGLLKKVKAFMLLNPSMSEEEAEEELEEIKEEKINNAQAFMSRMNSADNKEPEREETQPQGELPKV